MTTTTALVLGLVLGAAGLIGLGYLLESVDRWQRRWPLRRELLAGDWAALRQWARMARRHWHNASALQDHADGPRGERS